MSAASVTSHTRRVYSATAPDRKLLIGYDHHLAPGDYTILTPLIRDIAATYGDRYQIGVDTTMTELFRGNINVTNFAPGDPAVEKVVLCYKQGMEMSKNNTRHHFTNWMYTDFSFKTKIPVQQLKPGCNFHLSQKEKQSAPISGRYWLVMGGGKSDFITKWWDFDWYQAVVDKLRPLGFRFVQTGSSAETHVHPRMTNVTNAVGWGYLRELVWQIAHCEGIICPITCGMHIASAFNKPCVVIAGGREEPWWEAYNNEYGQFGSVCEPVAVPHRFLHTVGELDCCKTRGCWTNKLHMTMTDNNVCKKLAKRDKGRQELPLCMEMIKPDDVADAVLSYYHDGTLQQYSMMTAAQTPEPQILDDEVPWQPIANQNVEMSTMPLPARRQGLRWSHPKLGGKLTVCVCIDHEKPGTDYVACLQSILRTVPRVRLNLRIGYVQRMGPETDQLIQFITDQCHFAETFDGSCEDLQRWMPRNVDTNYIAWLDGNTKVVDDDWLNKLGDLIIKQLPETVVYGVKQRHPHDVFTFDTAFFVIRTDAVSSIDMAGNLGFLRGRLLKIAPFNTDKSLVLYPSPSDNPG